MQADPDLPGTDTLTEGWQNKAGGVKATEELQTYALYQVFHHNSNTGSSGLLAFLFWAFWGCSLRLGSASVLPADQAERGDCISDHGCHTVDAAERLPQQGFGSQSMTSSAQLTCPLLGVCHNS